jgi:hypothetical protein
LQLLARLQFRLECPSRIKLPRNSLAHHNLPYNGLPRNSL